MTLRDQFQDLKEDNVVIIDKLHKLDLQINTLTSHLQSEMGNNVRREEELFKAISHIETDLCGENGVKKNSTASKIKFPFWSGLKKTANGFSGR